MTVPISRELIEWADVILTMEDWQKLHIEKTFSNAIANKKIDFLDAQNNYRFMHPQLQNIIKTRVDAWLQNNL